MDYARIFVKGNELWLELIGGERELAAPVMVVYEASVAQGVEVVLSAGADTVQIVLNPLDQPSLEVLAAVRAGRFIDATMPASKGQLDALEAGPGGESAESGRLPALHLRLADGVLSMDFGDRSEDFVLGREAVPVPLSVKRFGTGLNVRLRVPGTPVSTLEGFVDGQRVAEARRALAICRVEAAARQSGPDRISGSATGSAVAPSASRALGAAVVVERLAWLMGVLGVLGGVYLAFQKAEDEYGSTHHPFVATGVGLAFVSILQTGLLVMLASYVASRTELHVQGR